VISLRDIELLIDLFTRRLKSHKDLVHHNDPLATCRTCADLSHRLHNYEELKEELKKRRKNEFCFYRS